MSSLRTVFCHQRIQRTAGISPGKSVGRGSTRLPARKKYPSRHLLVDFNTKRFMVASSQKDGAVESWAVTESDDKALQPVDVRAVVMIRRKIKEGMVENIREQLTIFRSGIGQGIILQLVSNDIDSGTNTGKRSSEAAVRGWLPKPSSSPHTLEYTAEFTVSADFGQPGAVIVANLHNEEFYLAEIVIHGFDEGPIYFPANSWIQSQKDNPEKRVFFSNQAYLPSQTPSGLKDLRKNDLVNIRGNGKGVRRKSDRIYDYAPYNDLGNPDKDIDLSRPVLGGKDRPYPRRCRTGRPPTKSDPLSESRVEKPHTVYVPRDEDFEEIKQSSFASGNLKAVLHNLLPSLSSALTHTDNPFQNFSEIDKLYNDGIVLKNDEHQRVFSSLSLPRILKEAINSSQRLLRYEIPAIISRDIFAWLRDNEFARQTLAGVNPVNIQRLKEFPILSKLDPALYGSPESAITKELLELELYGTDVEKAIEEGRLFLLDYHDTFLPFIKKMNSLEGRKSYASRTVFFLTYAGTLKPIAIELSLPPTPSIPRNKHVYTLGHDATSFWTWKMAKAHVCANDGGVHQLVNHW